MCHNENEHSMNTYLAPFIWNKFAALVWALACTIVCMLSPSCEDMSMTTHDGAYMTRIYNILEQGA